MKTKRALIMHPKDNVATSVEAVGAGEQVSAEIGGEWRTIVAREVIPFGFKIALTDIPKGTTIVKYGELIGKSSRAITGGDLVHIHNVEGTRGRGDLVTYSNVGNSIDYYSGTVIEGTETLEQAGERFYEIVLDIASGTMTRVETVNYSDPIQPYVKDPVF